MYAYIIIDHIYMILDISIRKYIKWSCIRTNNLIMAAFDFFYFSCILYLFWSIIMWISILDANEVKDYKNYKRGMTNISWYNNYLITLSIFYFRNYITWLIPLNLISIGIVAIKKLYMIDHVTFSLFWFYF